MILSFTLLFSMAYSFNLFHFVTGKVDEVVHDVKNSTRKAENLIGSAVDDVKGLKNPICGAHILHDTFDNEIKHISYTQEQLQYDYKLSYSDFTELDRLLKRYGEFSALVYCTNEQLDQIKVSNLRVGQFVVIDRTTDDKGRANSLLTYDPEQNQLILSFRGTTDSVDEIADATSKGLKPPFSITKEPTTGEVHLGFWERFNQYRNEIGTKLTAAQKKYKHQSPSIVVIGHSLGACWAYLQTSDLVTNWNLTISALYYIGSPICGETKFQDAIANTIGLDRIYRITNDNDIVPSVGLVEGSHPTYVKEYYFDHVDQVRVCDGLADTSCNQKWKCNNRSWKPHSFTGNLPIGGKYCKLNFTKPFNAK